jgi:hypothetical protein
VTTEKLLAHYEALAVAVGPALNWALMTVALIVIEKCCSTPHTARNDFILGHGRNFASQQTFSTYFSGIGWGLGSL